MKKILMDDSKVTLSTQDFELDEVGITKTYRDNYGKFESLKDEIVFILEKIIREEQIKIHSIESRVKELHSLLEKCNRKSNNDPFGNIYDISAARVICLFRSDIENLKKIVSENFDVISVDDKIDKGSDPLNYLSVHLVCKMKSSFSGPRYEKISKMPFEIQLRTLCMHCWATVSHYVDYKGDWDVPANLKMALSALSGLFYVADNEFENFNAAMVASKSGADRTEANEQDINLDTVSALLRRVYPERLPALPDEISSFVKEVKAANYVNLKQIQFDLESGNKSVIEYEKGRVDGAIFFKDVGAARNSLESASRAFSKVREIKLGRRILKDI